jgi:hypothetical protein
MFKGQWLFVPACGMVVSDTAADLMNHGSFLLDKCPEQWFMPLRIILY